MLYTFLYEINRTLGRNTTQETYDIWQNWSKCNDTHLDPNKLANVRRYIIKSNHLTDAKKDTIKERVIIDILSYSQVYVPGLRFGSKTS